jgi:hypothetical protein
MNISELRAWRDGEAAKAIAAGAREFMGKPDAWYEDIHWFCQNGHVSAMCLGSELEGDLCLACHEPVILGPPIGEKAFAEIQKALTTRKD